MSLVPEIERVDKQYSSGTAVAGSTWITFFGSGTALDATDQLTRNAHLYGLRSWDKAAVWKDSAGNAINKIKFGSVDPVNTSALLTNDIPSSPLVIDYDGNDKNDRIYVGNRYGNFFRIKNIFFNAKIKARCKARHREKHNQKASLRDFAPLRLDF